MTEVVKIVHGKKVKVKVYPYQGTPIPPKWIYPKGGILLELGCTKISKAYVE